MTYKLFLSKKVMNVIIYVAIILIILSFIGYPLYIYIKQFGTCYYSNKLMDWANFGDYIGGVLNPIIALLSLIFIVYITYLVSRDASKENKNLYLLQRRMEAYDELTKYIHKFNVSPFALSQLFLKINYKISLGDASKIDLLNNEFEEYRKQINFLIEFHNFLFNFKLKYGLLFSYDFDSDKYSKLLSSSNEIYKYFDSNYTNVLSISKTEITEEFDIGNLVTDFLPPLTDFVNEIREEIKI